MKSFVVREGPWLAEFQQVTEGIWEGRIYFLDEGQWCVIWSCQAAEYLKVFQELHVKMEILVASSQHDLP